METPTVERVEVDPADLLIDVNIRNSERLDKDFVESIREHGVLVPITAVRIADGDIRVRFGHRRTRAALEVGLTSVPVEIIGDENEDDDSQIQRIVSQYAENEHRAGLTSAEKVEVVTQLSAFGVKASDIVRQTRIKRKDVKAATAVAESKLATAAVGRNDFLTLDQAAALAEFDNDREAVKELVEAAKEGGFEHVLQRLRQDRQEEEAIAAVRADLEERGVLIIERPNWQDKTKALWAIGGNLTVAKHKKCPGHVAFVEGSFNYRTGEASAKAQYACTDPKKYGHLNREGRAAQQQEATDPEEQERIAEEAREERRRVIENNKSWRAATTVRREFVKQLIAKKSAPSECSWFVAMWLADPLSPASYAVNHRHSLTCELLGVEEPSTWVRKDDDLVALVANSGEARAAVLVLAMALGAHETVMTEQVWRRASKHHGRYLNFLAGNGYELSDIEQSVIEQPVDVSEDEDAEFDIPRCRRCGCTDEEACEGGCTWVPDPEGLGDLCSECAEGVEAS